MFYFPPTKNFDNLPAIAKKERTDRGHFDYFSCKVVAVSFSLPENAF